MLKYIRVHTNKIRSGSIMNTNEAVAKRIIKLLNDNHYSQYKLEQKSCVYHGAMNRILTGKNKDIKLSTIYKIANGFDMTILEFMQDDLFLSEDLEVE